MSLKVGDYVILTGDLWGFDENKIAVILRKSASGAGYVPKLLDENRTVGFFYPHETEFYRKLVPNKINKMLYNIQEEE